MSIRRHLRENGVRSQSMQATEYDPEYEPEYEYRDAEYEKAGNQRLPAKNPRRTPFGSPCVLAAKNGCTWFYPPCAYRDSLDRPPGPSCKNPYGKVTRDFSDV